MIVANIQLMLVLAKIILTIIIVVKKFQITFVSLSTSGIVVYDKFLMFCGL